MLLRNDTWTVTTPEPALTLPDELDNALLIELDDEDELEDDELEDMLLSELEEDDELLLLDDELMLLLERGNGHCISLQSACSSIYTSQKHHR